MKAFGPIAKLLIISLAAFAIQCTEVCTVKDVYYYAEPQYMSFEELRSSVRTEAPRELSKTGKIYYKDGYLYINEQNKGIHVIDNRDPENPVARSFISIPGNYDLAIMNNTLYADSYVDLVAIDISMIGLEREIFRHKDYFGIYGQSFSAHPEKGVVTSLKLTETTVSMSECEITGFQRGGWAYYGAGMLMTADAANSFKGPQNANIQPGNSTGIGGSMARFTITGNRLYTIEPGKLSAVNISDQTNPVLEKTVVTPWDVETIFPYNNTLFLGGRTGMSIFNLVDPSEPKLITTYTHMRSCDPVVVEGNYAYVTLRDGTTCSGFTNQLEVIDISDVTKPVLYYTYPMTNPHGLGIDNNTLFICDGKDGLKIYDASDKSRIKDNLKAHYKDIQTFDVIPYNNIAMMIAEDGLYQYDYSDLQNIRLISKLSIVKQEEE